SNQQYKDNYLACELIKDILAMIAPQFETENINFEFSYFHEKIDDFISLDRLFDKDLIFVNEPQFKQVLLNIINNSKDAINQKRKNEHNRFNGKIIIDIDKVDKFIKISIKDNGCGIAKYDLPKVFDPFFTTKEIGRGKNIISGVGLGLYISKLIVEEHLNGKIEVENLQDGAEFKIYFPIVV
ncbi:MAG: ATP-binding protein, partial [Campylobacterales bacterium]|nr:ATP-binding protein [Campylobacterales bacterium]